MAKHFIKKNSDGFIIDAYSSDFRVPEEGDICVNENGARHFHLNLFSRSGEYYLRWDGSSIVQATDLQKQSYSKNLDYKWLEVKSKRDILLQDSDWTQLSDSPLTSTKKTSWKNWRSDVRDAMSNATDPFKVIFPPSPD